MDPPAQHARDRMAALHVLLVELFTAEEFRRWLAHGATAEVEPELPGEIAAEAVLVDKAIGALDRRGWIDEGFFARLCDERPRKRGRISGVAALWLDEAAMTSAGLADGGPGMPDPSRREMDREILVEGLGRTVESEALQHGEGPRGGHRRAWTRLLQWSLAGGGFVAAVIAVLLWVSPGEVPPPVIVVAPIADDHADATTGAGQGALVVPLPAEPLPAEPLPAERATGPEPGPAPVMEKQLDAGAEMQRASDVVHAEPLETVAFKLVSRRSGAAWKVRVPAQRPAMANAKDLFLKYLETEADSKSAVASFPEAKFGLCQQLSAEHTACHYEEPTGAVLDRNKDVWVKLTVESNMRLSSPGAQVGDDLVPRR